MLGPCTAVTMVPGSVRGVPGEQRYGPGRPPGALLPGYTTTHHTTLSGTTLSGTTLSGTTLFSQRCHTVQSMVSHCSVNGVTESISQRSNGVNQSTE